MTGPDVPIAVASLQAWLFDLDGVLTRTADVHAAAWKEAFDPVLAAHGVEPPFDRDDYLRYVDGRPRADGVRAFLASRGIELPDGDPDGVPTTQTVAGLATAKNRLFRETLTSGGVEVFEGAVRLVRALRDRGVPTGVVSASENTRAVLEAARIDGLFDVCVDGVVVREQHLGGKPAPDSYLEGARLLGVEPSRSAMVEDALAGVEAGRAGGFGLVVGVDHDGRADRLRAHGADLVVTDLSVLVPSVTGSGPAGRNRGE